ncbi:MAG: hypothetical protein IKJ85_05930 [Firmicutes bacterium]|nr:hypothetical protein [Bacillota bacterium]
MIYQFQDLLDSLPRYTDICPPKENPPKPKLKTFRTNLNEPEAALVTSKIERSGLTVNAFVRKVLLECEVFERIDYQQLSKSIDVLCDVDNSLRDLYEDVSKIIRSTTIKKTEQTDDVLICLAAKIEECINRIEKEVIAIGNA